MKYGLVLLVLPVMMAMTVGCNNEMWPDDKWPQVVTWEHTENFDVTVELIKPFGVPQLTVPDRRVDVTCQVRSYHALQAYTIRVFLTGICESVTSYNNNLPVGSQKFELDIAETGVRDNVIGTYIAGSGNLPQGVAEIAFFFEPVYFPLDVTDWIRLGVDPDTGALFLESTSDRFIYHYRIVIEDQDGRTDTFEFDVVSQLKVEDDQN